MAHVIAWIFEALLRLLLPPSGRHRAATAPHTHSRTPATPRPACTCQVDGMRVVA